jgi:tetratricopeptide (TPR) repeat protein
MEKAEMLARLAAIEAKTGQPEQARPTFAEALATAQTIRRQGDTSAEWLPTIVAAEERAGFLDEATEACLAMIDSSQKDSFLSELAPLHKQAALKNRVQEILHGQATAQAAASDPEFLYEMATSLVKAGRVSEAIATAGRLSDGDRKAEVYSEIAAELKQAKDRQQLRAVVAEWTTIAFHMSDLPNLESNLHEIVPYQAELGMDEEMRQSFAVRLNAAQKKESKYVVEFSSPNVHFTIQHGPPFEDIAIDQAHYGSVAEAFATIRMLKDAEQRFRVIHNILPILSQERPTAEFRCASAEALAAARECKGYQVEALLDCAYFQAKVGLNKEANRSLDELLEVVCKNRGFGIFRCIDSQDKSKQAKNLDESTKDRVRLIFQEAIAVAEKFMKGIDREYSFYWIASHQARAGLVAEAAETARRIAPTNTTRTQAFTEIAQYAEGDQARQLFKDALAAAKTYWPAGSARNEKIVNLVKIAVEMKFFPDALAMTAEMENENGDRAAAMCLIATAESKAGQKDEARQVFAEAFAMDRDGYGLNVVATEAHDGLLTEALTDAQSIGDARKRAATLREIAVVLSGQE